MAVGGRSTLVGRRDELAAVKRLLGRSRTGNNWLEVTGDPGAGKSHLLAELRVLAAAATWTVLAGRATEPLQPTAYGVLAETVGCDADPDEIRRRLASTASAADGSGLALVVDDFHWADSGSAGLITDLVERPLPVPLLVCVAYRPRQAPPVCLPAGGTRLDLGPLSPAECAQLAGGRELYEASGGLPGYLKVLAGADPVVALAAEIASLGPKLLVIARAAAVAGDAFDVDLAAAVAQVDPVSAAARIEELSRRDLVRPASGPGRWRWRHPVVRTAVYGLVPPGWCLAAHERAAAVLILRGAGAADVAPHLARAGRSGDRSAIDLLERAGDEAAATAPTVAAGWWDAAGRLLPGTPESGTRRSRLLARQARALAVTGGFVESRALVHELLEQLPVTATEQRLAALRLEAMLALALGHPDEAAAALAAGSPAVESLAPGFHADRALVNVHRGRWADADRAADRALELAGTAAGLPPAAVTAHSVRALCAIRAGRPEPARRHLHRAATRLDRMADAELADHLPLAVQVAWAALVQERDETAGRHSLRGVEVGRRTGRRHVLPELLSVLAAARLRRGLVAEAAETVTWLGEASAGRDGLDAMVEALRAAVALDTGDTRAGLRHAERAVAARPAIVPGWDGAAEEVMARALVAHGDPDGCLTILSGLSGQELNGRRCDLGAEAAVMLGQVEEARRWAGLADAAATRSGLVGEVAYGLLAAARAALAAGDPTAADQQAAAAGSGFAALGWCRDEQRAGSVRSAAAGGGAGALTRREREIAELVCQGHLNREIAELLYLSPRTVENHVARILDKLGAASRAGVAMRLVSRERLAVSHAS